MKVARSIRAEGGAAVAARKATATAQARAGGGGAARAERERVRLAQIGQVLERVQRECDVPGRLAADPVGLVRRYETATERELMGLVCALVAFGNVKTIRAKVEDVGRRLSPSVVASVDDEPGLRRRLASWKHRVFRGDDVARLLLGARSLQREHGSLGQYFRGRLDAHGDDLREALGDLCDAIRARGKLHSKTRRGPAHLLPDPRRGSGSKRLFLFLRWMVRPEDGVDLGLWPVSPRLLLCPVDTHIHKLALNLGFTERRLMSWQTTAEITRGLARYDAADPTKYDFALCHMGMLQRCPSRRDERRCEGCGVRSVCRHWA